jgi:hypothetical protein
LDLVYKDLFESLSAPGRAEGSFNPHEPKLWFASMVVVAHIGIGGSLKNMAQKPSRWIS